jgi:hypothetical protein
MGDARGRAGPVKVPPAVARSQSPVGCQVPDRDWNGRAERCAPAVVPGGAWRGKSVDLETGRRRRGLGACAGSSRRDIPAHCRKRRVMKPAPGRDRPPAAGASRHQRSHKSRFRVTHRGRLARFLRYSGKRRCVGHVYRWRSDPGDPGHHPADLGPVVRTSFALLDAVDRPHCM